MVHPLAIRQRVVHQPRVAALLILPAEHLLRVVAWPLLPVVLRHQLAGSLVAGAIVAVAAALDLLAVADADLDCATVTSATHGRSSHIFAEHANQQWPLAAGFPAATTAKATIYSIADLTTLPYTKVGCTQRRSRPRAAQSVFELT